MINVSVVPFTKKLKTEPNTSQTERIVPRIATTYPVPYVAVIEKIIADWAKHGIVIAVKVAVINF